MEEMKDKMSLTEVVFTTTASMGVSIVAQNILDSFTPENQKMSSKLLTGFGIIIISSMAADYAAPYIESTYKKYSALAKKIIASTKEAL